MIEEGCTAIIVDSSLGCDSPNIGKIVEVGDFIGVISGFPGDDYFKVDKPIKTRHGHSVFFQRRSYMRRLYDDDQSIKSANHLTINEKA